MIQNLRKQQKGFTIIEVMIVLVIAAVILLIVFLAVPALQRNQRNTSFKNSVAAVLAGVTEFQNNNNGVAPTAVATTGGDVTISGPGGTTPVVVKVQSGYTFTNGTTMPAATTTGTATIYFARKCNAAATGFDTATTNRAVAAGFNIETSGAPAPQCQSS